MLMSANSFDTMSAQNAFWYLVTRVSKCLRTVHFCIQSFCCLSLYFRALAASVEFYKVGEYGGLPLASARVI